MENKRIVIPKKFIFATILLLLASVMLFFLARKTASLTLDITPSTATIKINKKTYSPGATIKLRPGTYTLEISAQDFSSKEETVSLSKNNSETISAYLLGSDSGFSYYETSGDDLYFLRKYSHTHPDDTLLSNFLTSYDKKLSIHDILPLSSIDSSTGESYYIFFETSLPACENLYCLRIGATSKTSLDAALSDLYSRGFNPEDYELITSTDH